MRLFKPSRLASSSDIVRHGHAEPYATVVLTGSYEEAGDSGRLGVVPGDVLLHAPFSAHRDRISKQATRVLDLPLPFDGREWPARGRIADPDQLVRLSERDPAAAIDFLLGELEVVEHAADDLPDRLALALRDPAPPGICAWAEDIGRSRENVSRQFRQLYDVAPVRYRLEAQARRAWRLIVSNRESLSTIAGDADFADQAHMTRSIRSLTHRSPSQWRAWSNSARRS